MEDELYTVINHILVSGIIVDVDCYAAKGGYFGGKLGEARVVLSVVKAVKMRVRRCRRKCSLTALLKRPPTF